MVILHDIMIDYDIMIDLTENSQPKEMAHVDLCVYVCVCVCVCVCVRACVSAHLSIRIRVRNSSYCLSFCKQRMCPLLRPLLLLRLRAGRLRPAEVRGRRGWGRGRDGGVWRRAGRV